MISLNPHQILGRQRDVWLDRKRVFWGVRISEWRQLHRCYIRRSNQTKHPPHTAGDVGTVGTGRGKRLEKIQLWSVSKRIVQVVSFGNVVEVGGMEEIGRGGIYVSDDELVMPWLRQGYDMITTWLCQGYAVVMTWLWHDHRDGNGRWHDGRCQRREEMWWCRGLVHDVRGIKTREAISQSINQSINQSVRQSINPPVTDLIGNGSHMIIRHPLGRPHRRRPRVIPQHMKHPRFVLVDDRQGLTSLALGSIPTGPIGRIKPWRWWWMGENGKEGNANERKRKRNRRERQNDWWGIDEMMRRNGGVDCFFVWYFYCCLFDWLIVWFFDSQCVFLPYCSANDPMSNTASLALELRSKAILLISLTSIMALPPVDVGAPLKVNIRNERQEKTFWHKFNAFKYPTYLAILQVMQCCR